MKTKVTHIQKTKQSFESNRQFIRRLGMSELEYNNLLLEIGCEFLEEIYPVNEEPYYQWYKEYAFSKSFWQWWKLEYNNWINVLIKKKSIELSIDFPASMRLLKKRMGTYTAFHNQYLKVIHNGSTNV